MTDTKYRSITNTCFRESLGEILISLIPKGNDGSAAHPQREQVALSTLNTQLEIEILSIIVESQTPDGEPIVAPNFGAARRQVLTRLGYACDKRSKASRVMSNMSSRGLFVRQDDDQRVWGFRSQHHARTRCKELKKELRTTSDKSTASMLSDILSGLTAPSAVATV